MKDRTGTERRGKKGGARRGEGLRGRKEKEWRGGCVKRG
jgi:hypothetical protein